MNLHERMKEYEYVTRTYLTRRTPAIIRVDGRAFHSFTKGLKKPFDYVLCNAMQETMKELCRSIQGCVLGYTQSDEISLILTDYASASTDAWFSYNIQKMASIAAATATLVFNKCFVEMAEFAVQYHDEIASAESCLTFDYSVYERKFNSAIFDARVFSIPKDEVCNCLIWRQQDATRNSIQSLGQAYFTHKELKGKSSNEIQDMLMLQKGINWNDLPAHLKRGSCCIKEKRIINKGTPRECVRDKWTIDSNIPIFTQDREYIDSRVQF